MIEKFFRDLSTITESFPSSAFELNASGSWGAVLHRGRIIASGPAASHSNYGSAMNFSHVYCLDCEPKRLKIEPI